MEDEVTSFTCDELGVAGTTRVFIRKSGELFEARVGIAIMGGTNMKRPQEWWDRISPFAEEFHDNYAHGFGPTQHAALEALKKDMSKISESLFASEMKCDCGQSDCPRCFKKGGA